MTDRLALLASLCALAACSPVGETNKITDAREEASQQALLQAVEAEATPDPAQNCLLMIWSEQEDPDVEFDRANDAVKGGAISCATGTSPSQFEAAISALREAARSGNRALILEQVGIPLLYIDEKGERSELGEEEIDALFDEVFDERLLALLQELDLSQMTVENGQGGFFELGSLWLVVDEDGRPRVMTVNRQALGEAAEAAREKAERGAGTPLE